MAKIKSVNVLMRQSGMVDEETGKLICPKDFIIRAYVYYDIAISLGKIDSYYLANKVEEEKKKLDALITEYFPGKRRRFNAKKDIIHRKNLLYQKSMLNLEAA